MRQLKIRLLGRDHLAQAFALIQAALGDVTLADWRRFARWFVSARARPKAGILAVADEQDYLAGLGTYRIQPDLRHGSVLVVEHFIALDLLDRAVVAHALTDALERLGRERGCTAIHTNLPDPSVRLQVNAAGPAAVLQGRGYRVESVRMCKRLNHPDEGTPEEGRSHEATRAGGSTRGAGHSAPSGRTAATLVRID